MSPRQKGQGLKRATEPFSDAQRVRLGARQTDQDRTLTAMQTLEAALGTAAPGRLPDWHEAVLSALAVLDDVTAEEAANVQRPDSLLSDIAHSQPRLRNRVRGVRLQYGQLREAVQSLRGELAERPAEALDFADVRQRLAWVLTSLRYQRARESDLIYEAYFDAFRADLRVEAAGGDEPGG